MTSNFECKHCACCNVFGLIDEPFKESFEKNRMIIPVKKGETVVREGDVVGGFYTIQKGYAKVLMRGYYKNKQHIIRLCKSGDFIGHRNFNSNFSYISVIALTDGYFCFFEKNYFKHLLQNNPLLSYKLLIFMANELHESEIKSRNYVMMSVKERVIESLLYIDDKFGKDPCAPFLSRIEIADIASTTRGQVSMYLKELEQEGLIKIDEKKITIVNRSALINYIKQYIDYYEPLEKFFST